MDKRAEPTPLIQTYPRVSVAHGPGVSIGLTGVPASFYLRSKVRQCAETSDAGLLSA